MNKQVNFEDYEVGYDIPAAIGMLVFAGGALTLRTAKQQR